MNRAALAVIAAVLATPAGAAETARGPVDCATAAPETWLPGAWGTEKQHITFRRDGPKLVWRYDRDPGLVTQRWGVKATASAEGTVTAVRGCEVEMKGRYVAYGGTPRAIGTPMDYVVFFDGVGTLSGRGLGFGKEPFSVIWRRAD